MLRPGEPLVLAMLAGVLVAFVAAAICEGPGWAVIRRVCR